jgi:hypothetical protein
MAHSVFLQHIKFELLPSQGCKIPRDRYKNYLYDLYSLYGEIINEETFLEGGQYTYAELGDALFEHHYPETSLKPFDTLIIAHWSHEFDPDYAACGPYFLERYDWNADMFDVCDQGTLAPFTALKILWHYQQINASQQGMVLCLEQTTIPRAKIFEDVMPLECGALAIALTNQLDDHSGWKIKAIDLISTAQMIEKAQTFSTHVKALFAQYALDEALIHVVIRKGTTFYKLLHHAMLRGELKLNASQLHFIAQKPGCLSAMHSLSNIIDRIKGACSLIMFDEDSESLTCGYLLMEKNDATA